MGRLKSCPSCGAKLPKATRKINSYNVFVKEMMNRKDIQNLKVKVRMKAISELWKRRKVEQPVTDAE